MASAANSFATVELVLAAIPSGAPVRTRHFLFLQGLPGPFFRRLGAALREKGARVSRVNFNGGDLVDWPGEGSRAYRGIEAEWPRWLDEHVHDLGVTDIIVFGDAREMHCAARAIADRRGLRFHAFEEGYLRPDHVTLERGGVNGQSSFPRSLHGLRMLAERLEPAPDPISVPNRFGPRALQATRYALATMMARRFFPHYCSHRYWPASREGLGWVRRTLRRGLERAASRRDMASLGDRPFFLMPLQIEGDSQLSHHSPFASMEEAMRFVVTAFATAPAETGLLIKRHPLDPGVIDWRRAVSAVAAETGLSHRVRFVEQHDLLPLIRRARGVVTVNSTVGPLALAEGTPVLALGDAVYRLPGITADCSLDAFWQRPTSVDADAFALLCRVLRAKCLVNGSFHSKAGLARLIECSVARLMPA